ncbi:MAG: winged helix-turn-helix transcriptional regulator, partial [Selenomonadaceae bacterium]|nr:winged helix-turn-helix transcriptional regulator [Selenomonadaceae bacterium]
SLTDKGRSLLPTLQCLYQWGEEQMSNKK